MAEFIPGETLYAAEPEPGQEERQPNWVDRFGAAFAVLVLAVLLFLSSFALILLNENKTVEEVWRLSEGSRLVVSLASDQPDSDTNGQLIHMTGAINTRDVLSDELFYISANGVKMARVVEMYQWQEEPGGADEDARSARKTVHYAKIWSQKALDSSKFLQQQGHANPPMEIFSSEYVAGNVNVGGFILTPGFILQLNDYQDFPMTPDSYAKINPDMALFRLHQGMFYRGANPDMPEIGDVRVRYQLVKPGREVSVIGMQNLDKIETFHTDYSAIKLITDGKVDADTMLRREVNARDVALILQLRLIGWFVMLASIGMALSSFAVLAPVLPLVSRLVGYNNYELSFLLSLAVTLMTVATAWIAYRPAFATGLLVLGASLLIITTFLKKKTPAQLAAAEKKERLRAQRKAHKRLARESAHAARRAGGKAAASADQGIPPAVKFLKAPRGEA